MRDRIALLEGIARGERAIEEGIPVELHYFVAFAYASLTIVHLNRGDVADARLCAERCVETATASEVPHAVARATLVDGLSLTKPRVVELQDLLQQHLRRQQKNVLAPLLPAPTE